MKKQVSFLLLLFGFFIVSFSSCVNHDYDLNNEKIDKNVVLSPGGVNLPYGNVDKIRIFEKIGYDGIRVAADGSLYIEYEGAFDPDQFQVPRYDIAPIDPVPSSCKIEQLPPGVFDFTSYTGNVSLLEGETVKYEVTKPQFENTDWSVDPNQIVFDSFTINLKANLGGFSNTEGNAKVNLRLTFPKDVYEVDGETLDAQGRITRSINFSELNNKDAQLPGIKVKSYKYPAAGLSNISLDLDMSEINGLKGSVNNPLFNLTLTTDNNAIAIQSIKGKVAGKTYINGEIDGFDALKNSFGGDAVLHFDNPSLFVQVNTNLGATFRLDIDKIDAHNGQSVSLTGNNGLLFAKPNEAASKTTSYYVAPDANQGIPAGATPKPLAIDNLFTSIPGRISYNFSMNVDEPSATIMSNNLILQGNYKFTLPFSFKDLKVDVKIAPFYLGENLYNDFLQYVENNITVKADTVIVSAEKFDRLELTAMIQFLDAGQQVIAVSAPKSVTLVKGLNQDKFAIDFPKSDLEKLGNAQYLQIEFILGGAGALTQNDYIDIRGLRFMSDGGIQYDFKL